MWGTPAGYEFRQLLDKWDSTCLQERRDNQIRLLVDGQNFVFFFECDGEVYAAHEPHRVTFARMKNPTEDDLDLNPEESNFMAFNLTKALSGKPAQEIFYKDDIPKIKVLDKKDAAEKLSAQSTTLEPEQIATGAKAIMSVLSRAKPRAPSQARDTGMPLNQDKDRK